jgi:hypothetical protein
MTVSWDLMICGPINSNGTSEEPFDFVSWIEERLVNSQGAGCRLLLNAGASQLDWAVSHSGRHQFSYSLV